MLTMSTFLTLLVILASSSLSTAKERTDRLKPMERAKAERQKV